MQPTQFKIENTVRLKDRERERENESISHIEWREKKLRNLPSTASSDSPSLCHCQTHSLHWLGSVFWCFSFFFFNIYIFKFRIKSNLGLGILTGLDCIKLFGLDLVLNKEFGLRMVFNIHYLCWIWFSFGIFGFNLFWVYLYTLKLSFYLFCFKFFVYSLWTFFC